MTERRRSLALWCALAYLIFAPLLETLNLRFYFPAARLLDMQRVFALLPLTVLMLLVVPALLVPRQWSLKFSNQELAGWALFFVLGGISSVLAKYPVAAWLEWSWMAIFFIFTVFLASALPTSLKVLESSISTAVLGAVTVYVLDFYVLNGSFLFDPDPITFSLRYPGFNNPRVFSDHQTILLVLIPSAVACHIHSRFGKLAVTVVVSLFFALAFAAGSRSLFLGHACACLAVLMLAGRNSVPLLLQLAKYWLFGGLIFFGMFPEGSSFGLGLVRTDGSGRAELWANAMVLVSNYPWLGVGPLHFAAELNPFAASPHNHLLQLMAEWGLPATAVFILMAGFFLRRYVVTPYFSAATVVAAPADPFRVATFGALVALIAQSFVSPVFNNPTSQMGLALLIAVTVATAGARAPETGRPMRAVAAIIAIGCLALSVGLIARWLPWLEQRNNCFTLSPQRPVRDFTLFPRFWEQGYLFTPCGGPEFQPTGE